ncbi:unnamed protein product [Pleuronectes platessa]|uniref:Uncharacterized protein n=1 Tax=Pleuronectes platessa TaxID=8262 RepID=A0A9N7YE67_PLEPL|nr:unnamed protein product [Pleuronectes platessa]
MNAARGPSDSGHPGETHQYGVLSSQARSHGKDSEKVEETLKEERDILERSSEKFFLAPVVEQDPKVKFMHDAAFCTVTDISLDLAQTSSRETNPLPAATPTLLAVTTVCGDNGTAGLEWQVRIIKEETRQDERVASPGARTLAQAGTKQRDAAQCSAGSFAF